MSTLTANTHTPSISELPPTLAYEFQVSGYIIASASAVFVWDTAINLGDDYQLLFKCTVRPPTVVYYLSRASTLGFIVTWFVFQIGNVGDCEALYIIAGAFNLLCMSMTSMLFLLRVMAVCHDSKPAVRLLFVFTWVVMSSIPILIPIKIRAAPIGATRRCTVAIAKNAGYIEYSSILQLAYDTAIFFAISYRVLTFPLAHGSLKSRAKYFFGGKSLPIVLRLLLQSGQHYYLMAVCGYIVLLVLNKLPVSDRYHGIYVAPRLINNIMACAVFRRVKFGLITHDGSCLPNIEFKVPSSNPTGVTLPSHHADRLPQDLVSTCTPSSFH
ncbi:hypothetical protein BDQ12DRAFT_735369 [Crucibulum laeve]|uniref:DUF6533 domain-containing protein n=1 Tax=Crucibulum laeve TaxID=68775 RepID=A0A5C3M1W1_9AGAR|nr:hypothetical protein BDQ12DRAFT_735369 [Crucibulum laeve]